MEANVKGDSKSMSHSHTLCRHFCKRELPSRNCVSNLPFKGGEDLVSLMSSASNSISVHFCFWFFFLKFKVMGKKASVGKPKANLFILTLQHWILYNSFMSLMSSASNSIFVCVFDFFFFKVQSQGKTLDRSGNQKPTCLFRPYSTEFSINEDETKSKCCTFIIIIINLLTTRVVGAPQMILQPVFSISLCSLLPFGTCQTPGLSIPWCCLSTSSSVCLVVFPLSLYLARWFWQDLMNGKHYHTTAVCVSLWWSWGLRVVQLPAGSWHGLPHW